MIFLLAKAPAKGLGAVNKGFLTCKKDVLPPVPWFFELYLLIVVAAWESSWIGSSLGEVIFVQVKYSAGKLPKGDWGFFGAYLVFQGL